MADPGDDRRLSVGDGPSHDLLVERPEVFQRAAAAADDDDVRFAQRVQTLDRRGDALRRAHALDPRVRDDDAEPAIARAGDAKHVAQRGGALGGHDAQNPREERERALARGVGQPFAAQVLHAIQEGLLERADAQRLHLLDLELHLTAALVDGHPAADQHLDAVSRTESVTR